MNASHIITLVFLGWASFANAEQPFNIQVIRQHIVKFVAQPRGNDRLVSGWLLIDDRVIGKTYENFAKRIPAGHYVGILRHHSAKNFVLDASGTLTHNGDFLIQIIGVPGRTGIVFHAGDKPNQSEGCILLGAVTKNPRTGTRKLGPDHPLRIMRTLFYGGAKPGAALKRRINIIITDGIEAKR